MTESYRAVSPVVAVILMVAVTVVLSAAVGSLVFNLGQSVGDSTSTQDLGVRTEESSQGVTVSVVTGSSDELRILVDGDVNDTITNPTSGDSVTVLANDGDSISVVSVQNGKPHVITSSVVSSAPSIQTDMTSYYAIDTGEGGTVYDSVGGNDGTISGATWTTNSTVDDYALAFDGVDDFVELDRTSNANTGTLSFWVYTGTNVTRTDQIILSQTDGSSRTRMWVELQDSRFGLESDVDPTDTAMGSVTTDTWYHVVYTNNGTTTVGYINGEKKIVAPMSTWFADISGASHMRIGAARFDGGFHGPYEGKISEIRVYERALSAREVNDLHSATR